MAIMDQDPAAFGAVQDIAKIRLMVYQHGEIAHVSLSAVLEQVNETLADLAIRIAVLEKNK